MSLDPRGEMEAQLNKLHRKFNILSSWLQLKFNDDPSFPQSIVFDYLIPNPAAPTNDTESVSVRDENDDTCYSLRDEDDPLYVDPLEDDIRGSSFFQESRIRVQDESSGDSNRLHRQVSPADEARQRRSNVGKAKSSRKARVHITPEVTLHLLELCVEVLPLGQDNDAEAWDLIRRKLIQKFSLDLSENTVKAKVRRLVAAYKANQLKFKGGTKEQEEKLKRFLDKIIEYEDNSNQQQMDESKSEDYVLRTDESEESLLPIIYSQDIPRISSRRRLRSSNFSNYTEVSNSGNLSGFEDEDDRTGPNAFVNTKDSIPCKLRKKKVSRKTRVHVSVEATLCLLRLCVKHNPFHVLGFRNQREAWDLILQELIKDFPLDLVSRTLRSKVMRLILDYKSNAFKPRCSTKAQEKDLQGLLQKILELSDGNGVHTMETETTGTNADVAELESTGSLENVKGVKVGGGFQCSHCGFVAKIFSRLESHSQIHSEERKFKCDQCPYAAKQKEGLVLHIKRAHRPDKIATLCTLCGEMFKGTCNLRKHISSVHENIRPHKCPICDDKAFKTKMHLKYHLKTHENPGGRKRGLNKERQPIPKRVYDTLWQKT